MWIGTWGDPEKETMAAKKLWVEEGDTTNPEPDLYPVSARTSHIGHPPEGARIISQHSDTTEPQIVFSDNR